MCVGGRGGKGGGVWVDTLKIVFRSRKDRISGLV